MFSIFKYNNASKLVAPLAASFMVVMGPCIASAQESPTVRDSNPASTAAYFRSLSAQWWQWALSIPTSVNPLEDTTGADCMVGQRGDVWFLAGSFNSAGAVHRTCSVPEGAVLFYPIANVIFTRFNCDGTPSGETIKEMRAATAGAINDTQVVKAQLDGKPVPHVRRIRSDVFRLALPEDNLFDAPCGGTLPEGVYSPAVDDGYYVRLNPLPVGQHTIHSETTGFINQNITYTIIVEPVELE